MPDENEVRRQAEQMAQEMLAELREELSASREGELPLYIEPTNETA
jgi:hypothetical protein